MRETELANHPVRDRNTWRDDGTEVAPVSCHKPYPLLEPGLYEGECLKARIFRDRQFRRWCCGIEFSLLTDGTRIFAFMNLGSGVKPHAGPRSEYRRAWTIANGERPRQRQVLSARVFEKKIYEVRIASVQKRFDGRPHPSPAIYSVVREIVHRIYP